MLTGIRNLENFTEEEHSTVFEKIMTIRRIPCAWKREDSTHYYKGYKKGLLLRVTSMSHKIMEQIHLEARQSTTKTEMGLETANMGSPKQIISQ